MLEDVDSDHQTMGFILFDRARLSLLNFLLDQAETALNFRDILFKSHRRQKSLRTYLPYKVGSAFSVSFDEICVLVDALLSRFLNLYVLFGFHAC